MPHGEGPGRHRGTEQHGWSVDVDATHTEENPSARRSFDWPDEHADAAGGGRRSRASAAKADEGVPVEGATRSGEGRAAAGRGKGHHDMRPHGRSQRPSGGKDESAFTDVHSNDDQETPKKLRRA
ncbi:hypothetical protein ACIGBH_25565 [Streptomyces sp. NPDC085929]|uniref:hypothetical protein n=1 Tax=Streptomyces sp. NPDC085929 TaxID=3365739 RepID=UPI0037D9034C